MKKLFYKFVLVILIFLFILLSLMAANCFSIIEKIGGASTKNPQEMETGLSEGAKNLVKQAFKGIKPNPLIDYHIHILGINEEKRVKQVWIHLP